MEELRRARTDLSEEVKEEAGRFAEAIERGRCVARNGMSSKLEGKLCRKVQRLGGRVSWYVRISKRLAF